MKERASLPVIRKEGETHRNWPGEEGRHLPKCPGHKDQTCEPSVCCLLEFHCLRCRKWRPFCFGHSESDECIACADEIEKKILKYVRESKRGYRRESRILYFLAGDHDIVGHGTEPTLTHKRIEDILFEMVESKTLEWFDDPKVAESDRGSEDLRYRIPEKKEPNDPKKLLRVSVHRKRKLNPASGARQTKGVGPHRRATRAK